MENRWELNDESETESETETETDSDLETSSNTESDSDSETIQRPIYKPIFNTDVFEAKDIELTIYLCIYEQNNTLKLPFLLFLLDEEKGSFPSFVFTSKVNGDSQLIQKCIETMQDLFQNQSHYSIVKQGGNQNAQHFKGFIREENIAYCFFEKKLDSFRGQKKTMDEIMNKQSSPIDPIVTSFFLKNTSFIFIENIPIPYTLYPCAFASGTGTFENNLKNTPIKRIDHDTMGNFFYFSAEGIPTQTRCAVFIENVYYALGDKPLASELKDETCIYFQKDSHVYWCVKRFQNFTILP